MWEKIILLFYHFLYQINAHFKFCVKATLELENSASRAVGAPPCEHRQEVHTCLLLNLTGKDKTKLESAYKNAKKYRVNPKSRERIVEYDYSEWDNLVLDFILSYDNGKVVDCVSDNYCAPHFGFDLEN